MNIQLEPFSGLHRYEWDEFVKSSRNATFLHERGFMDYHASRFSDVSLIFRDSKNKVVALFPANRVGAVVTSHSGLSYGGLLMGERLDQVGCLASFDLLCEYYRNQGVKRIVYKTIPHIYHREPAEDDLYALFRLGANLVRRDASSVIYLGKGNVLRYFSKGRKWSVSRAKKLNVQVVESRDMKSFHDCLSSVLIKHLAVPVHSVSELELLQARFPGKVRLFSALLDANLVAGALVFDCGNTVHTQYLASSESGRVCGALDMIISELIYNFFADRKFFSFGISTTDAGRTLNEGLIFQKEGFGAHTVAHDTYEWSIA